MEMQFHTFLFIVLAISIVSGGSVVFLSAGGEECLTEPQKKIFDLFLKGLVGSVWAPLVALTIMLAIAA